MRVRVSYGKHDEGDLVMNVTRSDVVTAAERSIAYARSKGHKVSSKLEAELMDVAQTADRLSMGWSDGRCGCLVGTARMRRGEPASAGGWSSYMSSAERNEFNCEQAIGFRFPKELIGESWATFTATSRVVDDGVEGMNIGKERRTIRVEPAQDPVPERAAPARPSRPARKPIQPRRDSPTRTPDREPAKR
jgi:hypothetical protein